MTIAPFGGKKAVECNGSRKYTFAGTNGPIRQDRPASMSNHLLTSICTGRATEYTSGE